MTTGSATPADQALLQHADFVRRVCRSVLYDPGQADDVMQETLLVALRHRPRHPSRTRAWLAGIARNLALKSLRSESRRGRRERVRARTEATDSTVSVAERLETQRRVVEAVNALDEPYRETVVARYFDEMTPTEIARSQGISPRTIETRLRRATRTLRAHLDSEFGERRTWCLALLPILHFGPQSKTAVSVTALGATLMSAKSVLITGALVVTAFASGWMMNDTPDTGGSGRVARDTSGGSASLGVASDADATDRAKSGAADVSGDSDNGADLAATAGEAAVDTIESSAPRFVYANEKAALSAVNWDTISESLARMPDLIEKMRAAILKGEMPGEIAGEIHRWNGPLITQGSIMVENGLSSDVGVNSAFTHPAVMVNAMYHTLTKHKLPLTEAQEREFDEIGQRFSEEERMRVASYGEDTIMLKKLIEESALKTRFFAEAQALLSSEQKTKLTPASVAGHTNIDLFSTGLVWGPISKPVGFTDRADLANRFTEMHMRAFDLDATVRADLAQLVTVWAEKYPAEFLDVEATNETKHRFMPIDRVEESARRQLVLREAMLAQLNLSDKQRKAIRRNRGVFVPYRKPAE
ncbi:MAG: sigma-70 family RNA polymerase sigma factor [Planctomycetota bacterium]